MITYLDGRLAHKEAAYVVIDVNGLGYHVNISLGTFSDIKDEEKCKLFTHFHVKEDAHTLYGFSKESERVTFRNLISISGIGPSTAIMMLSTLSPKELRGAIVNGDVKLIQSVKGIGAKTAQRVILELKDKLLKEGEVANESSNQDKGDYNTTRNEALQALVTLGIPRAAAEKAINKVMKQFGSDVSVELLIKESLKSA